MKKLAICIPNYNRLEKLERLVTSCVGQILEHGLTNQVEICINDDCSTQKPDEMVKAIKEKYPDVAIVFAKNDRNMGMDYNFLQSVKISTSEYCWIIGNDDLPTENGILTVLRQLEHENDPDILVGPFDCYDEQNNYRSSDFPLKGEITENIRFHTENPTEYEAFIEHVNNCNAVFGFLSNVVFKKVRWVEHGNMFDNKMDTIFIQMYMNLQTLREGAVYSYTPEKFIKNYIDDETNATFKRGYDILVGLIGVVDYFFSGEWHAALQKCIVNPYINGKMWDLPDDSPLKTPILSVDSYKNELYKKYFVRSDQRKAFFDKKKVFVYGAGCYGNQAVTELDQYGVHIISVIDADPRKVGNKLKGHAINSIDYLKKNYLDNDCIVVVANCAALEQIVDMLHEMGIYHLAIMT
jgi:glycosyltransferase involved in cell wall biosynthesis